MTVSGLVACGTNGRVNPSAPDASEDSATWNVGDASDEGRSGDEESSRELPEAAASSDGPNGATDVFPADTSDTDASQADALPADASQADVSDADAIASCGPVMTCNGYLDGATPVIGCLSPSTLHAGRAGQLTIYGQYLGLLSPPGTTSASIVVVGVAMVPLDGLVISACQLTVDIPKGTLVVGSSPIVVAPGGHSPESAPAYLTVVP
ncbi:MAG: hypothetical protein M3O46_05390 [Myxococcota bacterium]|nr:hypothetical protein [Myxococcota bacterium]